MPAFNFKREFVPLIKSGAKTSTIRKSKRGAVGRPMQLYTGQRTKECEKIMDAVCTGIYPITICEHHLVHIKGYPDAGYLYKQEGFKTPDDFIDFFDDHYGLPFHGYLHTWEQKNDNT